MIAACRTVVIDNVPVLLRPILRAGITLDREFRGLHKLAHAVAEQSLTAAVAIISQHHDVPGLPEKVLKAGLHTLTDPLLEYLTWLAGGPPDGKPKGKPIPLSEWYQQLFKIGTGWLGWTAEQTLSTAPCEIAAAYDGRIELLQAIFGKAEAKPNLPIEKKWRHAMTALGTVKPYAQAA